MPNLSQQLSKFREAMLMRKRRNVDPTSYTYSPTDSVGTSGDHVTREELKNVFDDYEDGQKVGEPFTTTYGSGKCAYCGDILVNHGGQFWCNTCRKQIESFGEFESHSDGVDRPQFRTDGVGDGAWNLPADGDVGYDLSQYPRLDPSTQRGF